MNYSNLVSDALVRALGWALVHTLWQAVAAALLLSLLLPRLPSARQRYRAAYAALMLVFAAAGAAFVACYEPEAPIAAAAAAAPDSAAPADGIWIIEGAALPFNLWSTLKIWLETNHALVVALWLLGFGFFLLRLAGGLWQIRLLRTRGLQLPEPQWLEKFQQLQTLLQLPGKATLWESARIHTPMAVGWLKPVVLLPIGLVNRLSPAEVEAVIAHELAHIARRDWIFNLLQAFIESLFYYHPAVWWMSSVIRRERENCCDDDALRATGNPLAFAKALVQVQEMATPVPVLAMAWSTKRRRPLLERVRRILNQPSQQQHQVMEKITATVILLALLALVGLKANSVPTLKAAFTEITELPATLLENLDAETAMESDTLPPKAKSVQKITREEDNRRIEAEYQDGKLTRLNIDGKDIPAAEFEQHEEVLELLAEEIEAPLEAPEPAEMMVPLPSLPPLPPIRMITEKDGEGNTVIRLENAGEPTEVVVKGKEVYVNGKKVEEGEPLDIPGVTFNFTPDHPDFDFNFSIGEGLSEGGLSPERMAELQLHLADRNREIQEILQEKMQSLNDLNIDQQLELERALKDMQMDQKTWEKEQKKWAKEQKKWAKDLEKWAKEQEKWAKEQENWAREQQTHLEMQAKNQAVEDGLKQALLRDKLISDPEAFSFQINEKEMKVNGKSQSESLRKKYLELVESLTGRELKGNGSFMYNFNKN